MDTTNNVEATVIKVIAEQLKVEEGKVNLNLHFGDDYKLDSLDSVELMMAFEVAFENHPILKGKEKFSIPDEDAEKLSTGTKVVEYIKEKLEQDDKHSKHDK